MMTDRRINPLGALVATIALSTPVSAIPPGKSIMVANCLGGLDRIELPADPATPSDDQCCNKGCHAANDRRKKGDKSENGCC